MTSTNPEDKHEHPEDFATPETKESRVLGVQNVVLFRGYPSVEASDPESFLSKVSERIRSLEFRDNLSHIIVVRPYIAGMKNEIADLMAQLCLQGFRIKNAFKVANYLQNNGNYIQSDQVDFDTGEVRPGPIPLVTITPDLLSAAYSHYEFIDDEEAQFRADPLGTNVDDDLAAYLAICDLDALQEKDPSLLTRIVLYPLGHDNETLYKYQEISDEVYTKHHEMMEFMSSEDTRRTPNIIEKFKHYLESFVTATEFAAQNATRCATELEVRLAARGYSADLFYIIDDSHVNQRLEDFHSVSIDCPICLAVSVFNNDIIQDPVIRPILEKWIWNRSKNISVGSLSPEQLFTEIESDPAFQENMEIAALKMYIYHRFIVPISTGEFDSPNNLPTQEISSSLLYLHTSRLFSEFDTKGIFAETLKLSETTSFENAFEQTVFDYIRKGRRDLLILDEVTNRFKEKMRANKSGYKRYYAKIKKVGTKESTGEEAILKMKPQDIQKLLRARRKKK